MQRCGHGFVQDTAEDALRMQALAFSRVLVRQRQWWADKVNKARVTGQVNDYACFVAQQLTRDGLEVCQITCLNGKGRPQAETGPGRADTMC